MINDGKPLTKDQLCTASLNGEHSDAVSMTESFANLALSATNMLTMMDRPFTGGIAMTSFAACAGIVQGEMEAEGLVPEITDEALTHLLVQNFKMGRELGMKHHADVAEARRADEVVKAANDLAARGGKTN